MYFEVIASLGYGRGAVRSSKGASVSSTSFGKNATHILGSGYSSRQRCMRSCLPAQNMSQKFSLYCPRPGDSIVRCWSHGMIKVTPLSDYLKCIGIKHTSSYINMLKMFRSSFLAVPTTPLAFLLSFLAQVFGQPATQPLIENISHPHRATACLRPFD